MKRKLLGRVSAVAMASAMMVSMFGMSVSAEEKPGVTTGDDIKSVIVNKTIETDGNTYAPNTTFSFNVDKGDAGEYDGNVVYEGVTDGLKGTEIKFSPSDDGMGTNGAITKEGTLQVSVDKFETPGVYHYVVSEEVGTYEGIVYDNNSYDVYVYVYRDEDNNNKLYVGNVVSVNKTTKGKADLKFTNDYGKNSDTTHDITITKKIEGDMANMSETFEFQVSVNGGAGEQYKVVIKEHANSKATVEYLVSGDSAKPYEIGNDGSIQIFGLSANDKYTVVETAANTDGYTTTVSVNTKDDDGKTVSGKLTSDNTNITYTNTKNANTPTGIIMNIAPYIVLVAFAVVAALFFLRRRSNREF